jgi:hypothetical protein
LRVKGKLNWRSLETAKFDDKICIANPTAGWRTVAPENRSH